MDFMFTLKERYFLKYKVTQLEPAKALVPVSLILAFNQEYRDLWLSVPGSLRHVWEVGHDDAAGSAALP
jgi:hypothetical protein